VLFHRWAPRYDERFVGYGLNKVSHLYQLATSGASFVVLPDHFVIAREHAKSDSWHAIFGSHADKANKHRLAALYRAFKAALPALPAPAAHCALSARMSGSSAEGFSSSSESGGSSAESGSSSDEVSDDESRSDRTDELGKKVRKKGVAPTGVASAMPAGMGRGGCTGSAARAADNVATSVVLAV
jgi:hypothetical protein